MTSVLTAAWAAFGLVAAGSLAAIFTIGLLEVSTTVYVAGGLALLLGSSVWLSRRRRRRHRAEGAV